MTIATYKSCLFYLLETQLELNTGKGRQGRIIMYVCTSVVHSIASLAIKLISPTGSIVRVGCEFTIVWSVLLKYIVHY